MKTRNVALVAVITAALAVPCEAYAQEPAKVEPDVVYGHKDGLALTMDVFRPEQPNGAAVLFMVSGGWFSKWSPPEQARGLFQPLLDSGYTVMAVRHGSSPKYSIPEIASDVRRAVRFVRHHHERWEIDPERLGTWGMSAGGHLALLLGTTGEDAAESASRLEEASSRVAASVAFVPPTDLRVAVWEAPESLPAYKNFPALNMPLEEAGKYSPLVHVSEDDAPALVIMGAKDELVPPKHGEWIAEAYKAKGVEHKLIVVPDAGHGLEGNHQLAFREAVAWFDQHLKNKPE